MDGCHSRKIVCNTVRKRGCVSSALEARCQGSFGAQDFRDTHELRSIENKMRRKLILGLGVHASTHAAIRAEFDIDP